MLCVTQPLNSTFSDDCQVTLEHYQTRIEQVMSFNVHGDFNDYTICTFEPFKPNGQNDDCVLQLHFSFTFVNTLIRQPAIITETVRAKN